MKKALIITTVSGFLMKFEMQDVQILQNMGYEVHYASNFDVPKYAFEKDELTRRGIRLHPVPIEKSPLKLRQNTRALRMIVRLIREEGICLIHCHTPVGGLLGRLAGYRCRKQGVRVIYTAHGFHFYRGCPVKDRLLYGTAERMLARATDALVVINREDYDAACEFRLKKGGRVYQIPGIGLDPEKFHPLPEDKRRQVRVALGIPEDAVFLLSVGEINRNKNHIAVLEALLRMREEEEREKCVSSTERCSESDQESEEKTCIGDICYPESHRESIYESGEATCTENICYSESHGENIHTGKVIACAEDTRCPESSCKADYANPKKIGSGSIRYMICGDGPSGEELKQWVGQHGLEQVVSFPGYCENPEEICGAADLFFFPSRREGLGMAALEALACGTPVAAADNRGSREYILPGKNGWMCRWDQPEDYVAAFRKWSHLTEAEKREMRTVCRASAERFDKKYTAAVMETVYWDTDAGVVKDR